MTDSAGPLTPGIPSGDLDDIPVEDLIRITREFTRRITNQDRQRESLSLRESGHQRTIQITAPITLQQFFSGEIDLDTDLARRFSNAPLLSHGRFSPGPGEAARRQATAILTSNDDSATVSVDAPLPRGSQASVEVTFTLFGALALRFTLDPLEAADRARWLELMRRENGIAFLWTRARWEQPYLIFVVREFFARLYAFSPHGFEAAARLTPDVMTSLLDWLDVLWFPERHAALDPVDEGSHAAPGAADWERAPTQVRRPSRGTPNRLSLRSAIPDAPEEQWDDVPAPPPDEATPGTADDGDLPESDLEW